MATVSIRYIVDDVDAAIEFYCRELGFGELMHPAPSFAALAPGDLRLVLSSPGDGPGGGVGVGVGGKLILVEDPSGNPVELFEPTRDEAKLSAR